MRPTTSANGCRREPALPSSASYVQHLWVDEQAGDGMTPWQMRQRMVGRWRVRCVFGNRLRSPRSYVPSSTSRRCPQGQPQQFV
jgi:hypothetical protein